MRSHSGVFITDRIAILKLRFQLALFTQLREEIFSLDAGAIRHPENGCRMGMLDIR